MNTILRFSNLSVIEQAIKNGDYEKALKIIIDLCNKLFWDERFKFRYLHIPELDRLVQDIGKLIYVENAQTRKNYTESGSVNLIIATELYETGGHTRVLADVVSIARNPTIVVITDAFDRYSTGNLSLKFLIPMLSQASVLVLPKMSIVDKVKCLFNLMNTLRPAAIGIFAHHQDVVAFSACNELINFPQIYIHHADHNPALGATVAHYVHMDLTLGNKKMCENAGCLNTIYFPMVGIKRFKQYIHKTVINTATCGAFHKFTTAGDLELFKIIKTILNRTTGSHFHIGFIPDDYLKYINTSLVEVSIDPRRFNYVGPVSCLSDSLLKNDVDIYITSAPVGGGKAYVEALGCGIAVLRYKNSLESLTALKFNDDFSYSDQHLDWENLEGLDHALSIINLSDEFKKSREHFTLKHDPQMFVSLVQRYF